MAEGSFAPCPDCGGTLHVQRRRFERRRTTTIVGRDRRQGHRRLVADSVAAGNEG
jgi:hypothetical protein